MKLSLFGKKKKEDERTPLFLYNSLSNQKELFVPHKETAVTMYSCGPTVYDYVHIGNLSSYLFADTLKRTLLYNGYQVKNTMNVTDFGHLSDDGDNGEDKMMRALHREKRPVTLGAMRELSDHYIAAFLEDLEHLNILPPTTLTRASDYVPEQIRLIETLVEKGYAYETSDGVYFDVSKFASYGKLGNVDIHAQKVGARVATNPEKRNPSDFALWKKGLLGWESVWGKGFPGWHIECTAMAFASLGKQIDIHTGGEDLKYTHHNGEIAQAEAASGKCPFVHYWMHNAFINIDNTKISKSLRNTITLRQLEDRGYSPDAFRYWILTSHYRTQANFTFEALDAAKQALFRLKRYMVEDFKNADGSVVAEYRMQFLERINDDLDTPGALALIWELVKERTVSPGDKVATLKDFDRVLAIGLSDERDTVMRELGVVGSEDLPEEMQQLLDERELARITQNWDEADRLRELINLKGYTLEDTPHGPRVSKKS